MDTSTADGLAAGMTAYRNPTWWRQRGDQAAQAVPGYRTAATQFTCAAGAQWYKEGWSFRFMNASFTSRFFPAVLATAAGLLACSTLADSLSASSNTVIGPNMLLADGAAALMNGDWERGVQLTQMGLGTAVSQQDRAAAYANLCAGYAGLKKYQRALESCDQSIAILESNWRAWQNRAAANLGLGRIDESLKDIQRGLQLNPDSQDLQKTLAIARGYEKRQQERMKHLLES